MRDEAGPQVAITEPGGGHTTLNPASSFSTNQSAINSAGAGATIWFPKGTYRLAGGETYSAVASQAWLLEQPAAGPVKDETNTAVIKRSLVVSSWTAGTGGDTGLWFATGQTQSFGDGTPRSGVLADAINKLFYTSREDYWYDSDTNHGQVLYPVATKADALAMVGVDLVRFFDDAADTVWVNFNPSGHVIERTIGSTSDFYLVGSNTHDWLIQGGILEHNFGTILGLATTTSGTEFNNRAEHVTMRMTHQGAVVTAWGDFVDPIEVDRPTDLRVSNCQLSWGGTYAITVQRCDDFTTDHCELGWNNWGPSAAYGIDDEGAQKNGNIYDHSVFNYNWVHHNNSSTWWDTNFPSTEIRENVFEDNPMGYAVMLEDEAHAVTNNLLIKRNLFRNNGWKHPWFRDDELQGQYHIPGSDYATNTGSIRLNATNNCEILENWFQSFPPGGDHDQNVHSDVEIGYQSRSTGTGPKNTWIHHNRHDWTLLLSGAFEPYRGFTVSDIGAGCEGWRASDNNKWDFNEYHVPTGEIASNDFFNRGGTSHLTWAQWQAGMAASCGGIGAPASHFDPNSTFTADL